MNPDQFHEPPEDVMEDQKRKERLREMLRRAGEEANLDEEAEALAEQMKKAAAEAAEHAVKKQVTVSISPRGRVRRNGPCPCGSGRKFKKCCRAEVMDPESDKKLPSPKAMRAYMRNQKQ